MQDAVEHRHEEKTCHDQEDEPRVEREEGCEEFSAGTSQIADRTHAAQQHCGVEQGIDPELSTQDMKANGTDTK
jgi:hypothetical protein